MKHRPYQSDCIRSIARSWDAGIHRQLVVQATGLGKTAQVWGVPEAIGMPADKRMLFIVNTDEQASQAIHTFEHWYPDRTVGLEKAESRAGDANVVVASRQTLGKAAGLRLAQFNPDHFGVIVSDEAHHVSKSTEFHAIFRHFRVFKGENPDESKLLLGLTATPNRSDNIGLEKFFDYIVYNYGLREAVTDGWLSVPKCHVVETEADLSALRNRLGDFEVEALASTVNTRARNLLVAEKYHALTPKCSALFFTVDVQHTNDLCDVLQGEGITCFPLSGKTPKDERRELIRRFKDREIQGLASCQVLLEGFDAPMAMAAHLCRPTQSQLLYSQMVGRVVRLYPSPEQTEAMAKLGQTPEWVKPHAIIIDYADNAGRHSLVTMPTLFGLRDRFDAKGENIIAQVEEIERLEEENPSLDIRTGMGSLDKIRSLVRNVDLLKPPDVPPEIQSISRMSWHKQPSGVYHLGLFDMTMLSVREDTLGGWRIYLHNKGVRTLLFVATNFRAAIQRAEQEIPAGHKAALRSEAAWKGKAPTDTQCKLLWQIDQRLRAQHRTWGDFYNFATHRYERGDQMAHSRGAISTRIGMIKASRT